MRRDVKKVISERPKAGRTWQSNTPRVKAVKIDDEGDQFNEGSNHIRQQHQKMRNTSTNVLKRFLEAKVGKPWSKVYSEICKNADTRSLLGEEMRQLALSLVITDCWMEGKTVFGRDWRGVPSEIKGLYVHPKSGLLLRRQ